jgi:hypothetical protein
MHNNLTTTPASLSEIDILENTSPFPSERIYKINQSHRGRLEGKKFY